MATRAAVIAILLASGVLAGLGLGQAFDPVPVQAEAAPARAAVSGDLAAFEDALASVAAHASPSVVHITTQVGGAGDPGGAQGVGSGVVVDARGHILTNNHVIDAGGGRATFRVRFADNREVDAKVVGADSETDLAVLRVDPKEAKPVPIVFADSDRVKVGHVCIAVGSPFGYSHSVTMGIVSAKHRRAQLAQPYQDFIQTDAAINPGNSGGALVNIRGELIGINAAIASETRGSDGVGFAIASNLAKWVTDQLLEHGRVRRGYLGIFPVDIDRTLFEDFRDRFGIKSYRELLDELGLDAPRGVLVYKVEPNTPAAKGGLKERDVILQFDGEEVAGQSDLLFKVAKTAPGRTVPLKLLRDKKAQEIKVSLGERQPEDLRGRRRR